MTESRARPKRRSPLATTLARLAAVEDGGPALSAHIGLPADTGWTGCADLAGDDAHLDDLLERVGRSYGSGDRAVAGSLFLRAYLWPILVPAVAAFLVDRRVPDVGAANVALRFDERGRADGVAFLEGRFAVLGGNEAAGAAGAVVLASEDEMTAWLGEGLAEAHVPGLFAALRRCGVRRSERALWGMVADLVAEAFGWAGPVLDLEHEARAFAEGMLDGSPHIPGKANHLTLVRDGVPVRTRLKNACCLYYRVGDAPCPTCPRAMRREHSGRPATRGTEGKG
ncbi:hypothetical protein GBA65_15265 [Rubrobacter marinus]|uniref:Aerobactin siderophore biosynthesis IucA/IucC-like C-terminal domain-containing protein n=1 Tax=Rubrobacter marinus TaxID=2653852 RepID=A0A6G8PZN6_9ACTN|nr:ferric iron reductase [Rubrobacter marinus]QIN79662.1 hypothetical protein GBA65_15265 [Rubrobacter marinus]